LSRFSIFQFFFKVDFQIHSSHKGDDHRFSFAIFSLGPVFFFLCEFLSKFFYKKECKLQIVKIYERKNWSPFAKIVLAIGKLSRLMLYSKFIGATSNIDGWGWRS
jgi:hypothetical protein